MRRILLLSLLVLGGEAFAQQSLSYKISDHVFNAGGHPADGSVPTSFSYRNSLGAIGELVAPGLGGTSFGMDGSFAGCYPPPGEVEGLGFFDETTLVWSAEPSAGDYNLYRDTLSNLATLGYGFCAQAEISDETATDTDPVPMADGYFYLVTAENQLDEEGTMGTDSSGAKRPNPSACP